MGRLLGWHTRAGELGLRLLQLHLLWVLGTLRGGIVLGLFPATAAVVAVLRRDALDEVLLRDDAAGRDPLRREFATVWRNELRPANVLGYAVAALWAVLLIDRHLLGAVDMGAVGPVLAGLLWVLTAFAFVMTACLPALFAHYAEGPAAVLRRAAVLVIARPRQAGLAALAVGVVLCVYYVVPGLVPVFGVALPGYVSFAALWGSGLLAAPDRPAGTAARVPAAATA
jgi:uncharacterized membrane protein YesL